MRWSLEIYGWCKDICRALIVQIVLTMQITFVISIKCKCGQSYFSLYSISSRIVLRLFSSCSLFFSKHYGVKFTKRFIDLVSLEMKTATDFKENNIQIETRTFLFIFDLTSLSLTWFVSDQPCFYTLNGIGLSVPLSSLTPNRRLSRLEMEKSLESNREANPCSNTSRCIWIELEYWEYQIACCMRYSYNNTYL